MINDTILPFEELLQRTYDDMKRWKELYENGGTDPICSDGINLNIIKTQIDIDIKNIKIYYPDHRLPDDIKEPEKVPNDFMVKANEIKKQIPFAFQALFDHPDYLQLSKAYAQLSQTQKQKVNVGALRQKEWCLNAIEQGDLIGMRKYVYMDVESFHELCRKHTMKYDELLQEQSEDMEQMKMEL